MKKAGRHTRITRRKFVTTSALAVAFAAGTQFFPASILGQTARTEADALFLAVADTIIPRQGQIPAASEVGASKYVQRRVAGDASFSKRLASTLQSIEALSRERFQVAFFSASHEQKVSLLKDFENKSSENFAELRDTIYESYYTNPEVWRLLGYTFRSGPKRTTELAAFNEKLLARVKTMPARYRRPKK